MKIAICGSMAHKVKMAEVAGNLRRRGYEVEVPDIDGAAGSRRAFIDAHFAKIDASEAILVVNADKDEVANYIGVNTVIEIAHAYSQGLDIFLLNAVPEVDYADEIQAMNPIVLDGDLGKIDDYIESLPLVFMSTESALKQSAVSRAMRRVGIPVRVDGKKVDSGVNEQPATIDETYTGAVNRHANLKKLGVSTAYFATVEGGLHPAHENHSSFGCDVVILEKAGEGAHIGIHLDVEYPQDMLDKIPSEYADVGAYAQQVWGAKFKDPYPFLTNGRMTRQQFIENAMYNVAVQL